MRARRWTPSKNSSATTPCAPRPVYRITAKRKRAAQDALGPLQISADARQIRPDGRALLPAEALREQVGQVAVPFGICTEPANVAAHGRSSPFRHRCLGCEYFRTGPFYQPELRGQLLADAERFAAAPQLADWARADAAPSPEEIQTLRRLILANEEACPDWASASQPVRCGEVYGQAIFASPVEGNLTTIREYHITSNRAGYQAFPRRI